MQKIKHGKSFKGVLLYCFGRDDEHKNEAGLLIGGNMSGTDIAQLTAEFHQIRLARKDISKPVWHQSLRLPEGELLTTDKWCQLADDYMSEMGFTEDYQRCYILHDDEEGQHIHIIANRISTHLKVKESSHESMKSTQIIYKLEKKYDLITSEKSENKQDKGKKTLKKNEIEKAVRTGEEPLRQQLQKIVDESKKNKPTVLQFIERLAVANVRAVPNIASTGKMNGFSFEIQGVAFKASQLGKDYSWNKLKDEVSYDKDQHSKILQQLREQHKNNKNDKRIATIDIEHSTPATDRTNFRERSDTVTASSACDRRTNNRTETSKQDTEKNATTANRTATADNKRLAEHSNSNKDRSKQNSTKTQNNEVSSNHSTVNGAANYATNGTVYDSIVDLVPKVHALTNSHKQKLKAWGEQSNALNAPFYRLTLTSRRDNLPTYNYGKKKGEDGSERFYDKDEVANLLPFLSRQNVRGYDIYITPIDQSYHYLVIDDMHNFDDANKRGFSPCLVQSSSNGNYQAVIKVRKEDFKHEQQIANKLVVNLNSEFGDPKFSGVVHPFRLAGFSNKKPGKNNFFTKVIKTSRSMCQKVLNILCDMRESAKEAIKNSMLKQQEQEKLNIISDYIHDTRNNVTLSDESKFINFYREKLESVKKMNWVLDLSRVDFFVVKRCLSAKIKQQDVKELLIKFSPNVHERHNNINDYADRTINAALIELNDERAKRVHHTNTKKIKDFTM